VAAAPTQLAGDQGRGLWLRGVARTAVAVAIVAGLATVAMLQGSRAARPTAVITLPLSAQAPAPAVPCDSNGVNVGYTSNYVATASPATFRVQSAQVGGIDAVSCAQLGIVVRLRQGTTVLATGGPVPITGTSLTVPFSAPPQSKLVTGVTVEITVIVPALCAGITFGDYIIGKTGVKETLTGGGGNDYVLARGTDVALVGGGGNDCLIGGPGTNRLDGGGGNDVLIGGTWPTSRNDFNGAGNTDVCKRGRPVDTFQNCEQIIP